MATQWHPLFGLLLRPGLEGYYELHTSLPVGDAPRQADFVLLRRTNSGPMPFTSLWRHLAIWNVVEFKGPTAKPRHEHATALLEVGLGIARKLNAERAPKKPVPAEEIAFWYLANRLSSRYVDWFRGKAVALAELGPGLWRSSCWGHPVYMVSGAELPIDEETLPLHVVGQYEWEKECAVAEFVGSSDALLMQYGPFEAIYHPRAWKEVGGMAKARRKGFEVDIVAALECLGHEQVIHALGAKRVLEALGPKQVLDAMGHKQALDAMGHKQALDAMGHKQALDAMGSRQALEAMDVKEIEEFLASKRSRAKAK